MISRNTRERSLRRIKYVDFDNLNIPPTGSGSICLYLSTQELEAADVFRDHPGLQIKITTTRDAKSPVSELKRKKKRKKIEKKNAISLNLILYTTLYKSSIY